MARKSGMKLEGYPNYIAPYNIQKLSDRHFPLGNLPVYPSPETPETWFEEKIAADRYKDIANEWARIHESPVGALIPPGTPIMWHLSQCMGQMVGIEKGKFKQLIKIAEDTVREYFNLDKTEVLFDLELIDPYSGQKPADSFNSNKGTDQEMDIFDPEYKEDFRKELIRRRLTNALIQGASLKGHFIFHMAADKLEKLNPGCTKLYNSSMITNDLMYYYQDDLQMSSAVESESQAGMMEVDYSGDVPVVRAKSFCFTVLVHEMIKGVVEMLSAHGLPKDATTCEMVLELCDTVLLEMWDIRIGPKFWEMFYGLIDADDHEMLKHVIVGVSQLDTDDFLDFMGQMLAGDEQAKRTVAKIIKLKRAAMMNFEVEMAAYGDGDDENSNEDDMPGIDWSSLGL